MGIIDTVQIPGLYYMPGTNERIDWENWTRSEDPDAAFSRLNDIANKTQTTFGEQYRIMSDEAAAGMSSEQWMQKMYGSIPVQTAIVPVPKQNIPINQPVVQTASPVNYQNLIFIGVAVIAILGLSLVIFGGRNNGMDTKRKRISNG